MKRAVLATLVALILLATALPALAAESPALLYRQGGELAKAGDSAGAIKLFSRVIELDKFFIDAYVSRGYLYIELGELELALADCKAALGINPQQREATCNIALVYAFQGRLDDSLAMYKKAMELWPWRELPMLIKGIEQEKNGRKSEAIAGYNAFLDRQPDPFIWRAEIVFAEQRLAALGR